MDKADMPPCMDCGKAVSTRKTRRCRACWLARTRLPDPNCMECGNPLPRHAVTIGTKRCRACFRKRAVILCQDCGKRLHRGQHGRLRCRDCHVAHRRALAAGKACSRPGCTAPFAAKGYCMNHYATYISSRRRIRGIGGEARFLVRQQPCAVCGYSRMPSEPHRIIPGGPYELGNMVPVCSRCHDEIERGLTPCTPPWRPD